MTALDELREFIAYDELSYEGKEQYDRLIAAVLAERADLAAPLSDEAVSRALRVWGSEGPLAFMARSLDYLGDPTDWRDMPQEERDRRHAALRVADAEAHASNVALMRRALAAALGG